MRAALLLAMAGCGRIGFGATPADATEDAVACVEGEANTEVVGVCWMLFSSTPRGWDEAESHCVELGGHLATLTNVAENEAFERFVGDRTWIGASDQLIETEFRWTSGVPFVFEAFTSNEPNSDSADCVEMIGSGSPEWNEHPCATLRPYVCQR